MEIGPHHESEPTARKAGPSARALCGAWLGVAALLACWNGIAASYASPFHILHPSDSVQYHLLVRNRLNGHYEVGDGAHTVRTEGFHPVWRPGIVWLEEILARRVGSVATSAVIVSAVGTTLLECLTLWLTQACFGWPAAVIALACMLLPLPTAANYLFMAIGIGAEPWAGAALIVGLVGLVVARQRRSWPLAVVAGVIAGMSECFRTGNHLLFAVPCACYGLGALPRHDWRGFLLPAVAGSAFLGMVAASNRLVPSEVDKTTMNLWHRELEFYGEKIPNIDGGPVTLHLGGLRIADDAPEDYYDYAVPRSKGIKALDYFSAHWDKILAIYLSGLRDIAMHGASGLRAMLGNMVFAFFVVQFVSSLALRNENSLHALSLGGGAMAHHLVPTALLRGDEPAHYTFVSLSIFVIVAAGGVVRLYRGFDAYLVRTKRAPTAQVAAARPFLLALVSAPLICLSAISYLSALTELRRDHAQALEEQAALDRLQLEGKRVACRNMSWFLDRNVVTAFFPYGNVHDLERFVRGQGLDGLLIWENERQLMFWVNPYGSLDRLEEALRQSPVFAPPRISGAWRWYPVHHQSEKSTQTGRKKTTLVQADGM